MVTEKLLFINDKKDISFKFKFVRCRQIYLLSTKLAYFYLLKFCYYQLLHSSQFSILSPLLCKYDMGSKRYTLKKFVRLSKRLV